MAGEAIGTLALVVAPVCGGLYFWVNRQAPDKGCRHGHTEALYCYRLDCRFGALNWLELTFMTLFMVSFSAGLAYATDPEGWLEMGRGIGQMPMSR